MLAITPRKVEAAGIAFNHPLDPGPCPPAANATGRPAAAEPCSIKPPAPGPSGRTPGRPPAALVGLRADQLVCPGDGLGVVESRRLSHLPAHLLVVHAPGRQAGRAPCMVEGITPAAAALVEIELGGVARICAATPGPTRPGLVAMLASWSRLKPSSARRTSTLFDILLAPPRPREH